MKNLAAAQPLRVMKIAPCVWAQADSWGCQNSGGRHFSYQCILGSDGSGCGFQVLLFLL